MEALCSQLRRVVGVGGAKGSCMEVLSDSHVLGEAPVPVLE